MPRQGELHRRGGNARPVTDRSPETAEGVLAFWFFEASPGDWWSGSPAFDARIRTRFSALHAAAAACELWTWRASATGRLAEILILDQFSRNLFRGRAEAFASDPLALALAQAAVAAGDIEALKGEARRFVLMPFMHSESRAIHAEAEALFARAGGEDALEFERRHRAIIERFGRYPHRNAILGRASTPEELEFLKTPGSSF